MWEDEMEKKRKINDCSRIIVREPKKRDRNRWIVAVHDASISCWIVKEIVEKPSLLFFY
jgi:hypothetical protein